MLIHVLIDTFVFTYIQIGVIADVLDSDIVVNVFEFQSRYYVHIQTNTFGKGMNPLIPQNGVK